MNFSMDVLNYVYDLRNILFIFDMKVSVQISLTKKWQGDDKECAPIGRCVCS
jgi:hypothetical protein